MYNLLSNAVKFTGKYGRVTIRTSLDDDILRVEVADTGVGISECNRSKIFSKFSQIDSSYSRKQEGTGLGLILTKKLVELHNGQIDFDSKEGIGTTFWFTMPEFREN